MDRSATNSGSAATIPRPVLPPLPPAIQAHQSASTASGAAVVPAPVATAAAVAAVAPTPMARASAARDALSQIRRPDLPPTPPELAPLPDAVAEPALTASASDNATSAPAVALVASERPSVALAEPAAPTAANAPAAGTFAPTTSDGQTTPADIILPGSTDTEGKSKKAAKKDKKKSKGTASSGGSSLVKPLLAAAVALALIGGAVWFVMGMLGSTTIVSDLQTGQCVENFFDTGEDGGFVEIFAVSTVDCAAPHAYEVFSVTETLFPSDTYPGIAESFATGQDYCLEQYVSFIGGGEENLTTWDVWTFVPPENSWSDDRRVHCLVGDFAETTPTTGSLQGIAAE